MAQVVVNIVLTDAKSHGPNHFVKTSMTVSFHKQSAHIALCLAPRRQVRLGF